MSIYLQLGGFTSCGCYNKHCTFPSGSMEALPASRIVDIVTASSLSDDDIQQLIDQLLEKMNTNAEWQAVSSLISFHFSCLPPLSPLSLPLSFLSPSLSPDHLPHFPYLPRFPLFVSEDVISSLCPSSSSLSCTCICIIHPLPSPDEQIAVSLLPPINQCPLLIPLTE